VFLEVSQNSTVLGTFSPIETADNINDFYNYLGPADSFGGTGVIPMVSQTSQITVHGNVNGNCELSVLLLHDNRNDGSGGRVYMTFEGNFSQPLIQDDPPPSLNADYYDYDTASNQTEIRWTWNPCCTDGMADPVKLSAVGDCVSILKTSFESGIDRWVYIAGPLAEGSMVTEDDLVDLDMTAPLKICRVASG